MLKKKALKKKCSKKNALKKKCSKKKALKKKILSGFPKKSPNDKVYDVLLYVFMFIVIVF